MQRIVDNYDQMNPETQVLVHLLNRDRMGESSYIFNEQIYIEIINHIKDNINNIQFNNYINYKLRDENHTMIHNSILDELIHFLGDGYAHYNLDMKITLRQCWEELVLIPSIKEIFKHKYCLELLNNITWIQESNDINHEKNPLEQDRGAYQTFGSLMFNRYYYTINEVINQLIIFDNRSMQYDDITSYKLVLPLQFPDHLLWSGFRYFPNIILFNTIINIFNNLSICYDQYKLFIATNRCEICLRDSTGIWRSIAPSYGLGRYMSETNNIDRSNLYKYYVLFKSYHNVFDKKTYDMNLDDLLRDELAYVIPDIVPDICEYTGNRMFNYSNNINN